MIRFRQIHDLTRSVDQRAFETVRRLFRGAFPVEPEAIDRIERMLDGRRRLDFEPLLLASEDRKRSVTGISFTFYFPEIEIGYLQYIASDPERPARGIGGALYEATRELIAGHGGRGLLFDVPPDERAKLREADRLADNRRRIRFYERYGARVVEGTGWDTIPNPRNDSRLTLLMFDGMGRTRSLDRRRARTAVRRILASQYGYRPSDPFVEKVARSFRDDPVRLRAPHEQASRPIVLSRRLKPICVVAASGHAIHHVRQRGYVERPVRVRQILKGLEDLPIETIPVKRFPERHVTDVHDPRLVAYLRTLSKRLDERAIVYPEVFPIRRPERAPKALEDRAGYFCADTFTPITHMVYPAARHAVDVALTAAERILEGDRFAYALCRPPGHHAERRIFGGFCYFNNSAIAANFLCRTGKVALLDLDYHHGNGGQYIFYSRSDVMTLSIHGHPRNSYPNFSGYADEIGEGAGAGFNRNWPLAPPVDDARYLRVLDKALGTMRRHDPACLVVSLGFDIMKGDPTGSFAVTVAGLEEIARRIASLRLPTLFVQEGGYAVRNLRIGARGFFGALATASLAD